MRKIFTSLFLAISINFTLPAQGVLTDQYGLCSGITSGYELTRHKKVFSGLNAIGVNWTRCGFFWNECSPEKGVWDCQHLDHILSNAKKSGVNVLPILCYDARWARPVVEHLYDWGDYVQEMVSRYGKQLRYWEVYNEPNLKSYWCRTPNGAEYAALLQKAYQVIKSQDPDLQVVFGGLSGVPLDFIEDALKAGAGQYFDVMNIHPYNLRDVPETLIPELQKLHSLLNSYGVGNKPIWISEIGWSTAQAFNPFEEAIEAAYDYLEIEKGKYPLVCVRDSRYGESHYVNHNPALTDRFIGELEINMDAIAAVDPSQYPVMLPARGEKFPAKYVPALQEYLKKGGTLLFNNGTPLSYDIQLQEDGTIKQVYVGRKYCNDLHIHLEFAWSNPIYPKEETWQAPGEEFKGKIFTNIKGKKPKLISKPLGRYLTEDKLRGADKLIPIINAGTDHITTCIAGLYQFNSDLNGNIILLPGTPGEAGVTEERQAFFLPRSFIVAYALGVDKVFWNNYRSPEENPTDIKQHYGIVHKDFSPKPSHSAMQTLVSMLPSGSSRPVISLKGGIYTAHWKNDRGTDVWAYWCEFGEINAVLDWEGNLEKSVKYSGEEVIASKGETKAGEGCIYLVGPSKVTIERK